MNGHESTDLGDWGFNIAVYLRWKVENLEKAIECLDVRIKQAEAVLSKVAGHPLPTIQ